MIQFTPTQQSLLEVLSDGERHTKEELVKALSDDLARPTSVKFHIRRIRQKLEKIGELIVCETDGRHTWYRRVRKLSNPYDGRI